MELYAKDLRIGNWVYNPIQKINILVDFNVLNLIRLDNLRYAREIKKGEECFQPIPLTEEIVKKTFLKDDVLDDYILNVGASKMLTYSVKSGVSSLYFIKREGRVELNFLEVFIFEGLHDLQNWYYYNNDKTELKIEL